MRMVWALGAVLAYAPIVAIAALEAGLGLAQYFSNQPGGVAHGTYVNRNHFAGFLELGLALAVGIGFTTEAQRTRRKALAMVAAVILAGILHSLSRMGFTAALFGLEVGRGGAAGGGHAVGDDLVQADVHAVVVQAPGFLELDGFGAEAEAASGSGEKQVEHQSRERQRRQRSAQGDEEAAAHLITASDAARCGSRACRIP